MKLNDFFDTYRKAAVAFSGRTDSAYLLYMAKQYGVEVKAYYVKSAFQPQFELNDALRFSEELGIPLEVLNMDILSSEMVTANSPDRC